jgi:O-antigen ligase
LILLTENDPIEAVTRVLKRCTYVVAPVSILFIKYFPEWGRGFSNWTGAAYNTGITENKNSLGWDCLILGFFFVWHLFRTLGREKGRERRDELLQCIGFLWMIGWLFMIADSKTPLLSVFLAIAIFLLSRLRRVNKSYLGVYVISIALILFAADGIFNLYEPFLEMMGRNASLTERKPLWDELLRWGAQNPMLGTGFESFWLGDRRETIWDTMKWAPSQAHNGYLETYINTGLVGLCLLLCLLVATYRKALRSMARGDILGQFRFPFLFAIVAYNWTEASMYGLHPIFFMLFLVTMDLPASPETVPAIDNGTDTDRTYYAAT